MQLNFKIKDDHIQLLNAAITPINKSVNYLTAAFDFDDVWDGTRVTAVFCGRNNAPVSVLLDGITNICVIPWEVLQSDVLKVSAYGLKEDNGLTVRITSNTVELKLDKAGPVQGAEPLTPSFTSWEQVVGRINDIEAGIVTDGSIGIAKLGDDILQILNGKIEYEECSDVDNPPWRTGVFTNDDRSVIVLSVYKKIVISQIGSMVSYDEYCYQLKISSSSIKKRSFSHRSGTEPPTPEWTDLIDTTELSEALEAETTNRTNADNTLIKSIESLTDDIMELSDSVNEKEDMIHICALTDTEVSEIMSSRLEYRLGEVTSLTLNLPDNVSDDYISSVIFTSGATATNLIYPDTIKMLGEDCIDCVFTPVANKRYEVIISYDGVNCVGVVGGYAV